jgi:hypothetical protein
MAEQSQKPGKARAAGSVSDNCPSLPKPEDLCLPAQGSNLGNYEGRQRQKDVISTSGDRFRHKMKKNLPVPKDKLPCKLEDSALTWQGL